MDACGEAGNQNFQQRYHAEEVEERFGRFKPGIIRYFLSLTEYKPSFPNLVLFESFGLQLISARTSMALLAGADGTCSPKYLEGTKLEKAENMGAGTGWLRTPAFRYLIFTKSNRILKIPLKCFAHSHFNICY